MKRITIRGVLEPDATSTYTAHRTYYVVLGNRRRVPFTSRRDAKAFQAATEQFLNELMHEANGLLAQALHDYRMAWPALKAMQRGNSPDQAMTLQLRTATEALDRAAEGPNGPNRMHFAWLHLGNAIGALGAYYAVLADWYAYKTQGVWRHQAAIARRRCLEALQRLATYGATDQ